MKKLIAAFVLGVSSVVLLGAAGGNADLESQLKRPEARQALSSYIQQHCSSDVNAYDMMKAIAANDGRSVHVQTFCGGW